ncbi:MAG: TetR/AcrR family transcriptional regulator [Chloroflexi bacterium]|nr:TetR/AcrR family transcriptional regulator [Chloroflexota bacterium]
MSSNPLVEERVDPRIRRTRGMLGQALSDVLAEKNFQGISVQDITEKAGVNRTTFYLHFPDKYALLDYNISQLFRQELEKRMLSICHYSPENLNSLIITVADFILFSTSHCESRPADQQFEALVEMAVKKQVQDVLQAWGEKTEFGSDPQTIGIAASWAIYGLAQEWNHDKKRPAVESFASKITPLINAILSIAQPA